MMRLMSDLIAYLRDLLVFKAKPDALKEDVDPDVQKSLAAHAELITTDRLLDLIDQFAAAEGRMKWAPNKRLHFEVAVIKAIQTLSQVTLNEVIENLAALRDGKSPTPPPPSEGRASARPGRAEARPSVKVEAPRVAEKAPVRETKADAEEPVSAFQPSANAVDHEAVWRKAVVETR